MNRVYSCTAGSSNLATIRGVMGVEYRAAVRMVAAPDFAEGVRRATLRLTCPPPTLARHWRLL